jgi:glycosyltransferase involved in cell wall biosynthesis
MKLSVVIRNKNQDKALGFLLKNLRERYVDDVDEIIVIDNLSTDKSEEVTASFNAQFETIEKFSYGGSANFAAQKATRDIVVIFSAHSYPVTTFSN